MKVSIVNKGRIISLAQTKHYKNGDEGYLPKEKICIFCNSKKGLNIFWSGDKKDFYVCDDSVSNNLLLSLPFWCIDIK